MFNHYSVRPIGSVRFERHLAELSRECTEKQEEAQSNVPVMDVVLRRDPTEGAAEYNPIDEGYRTLMTAITAKAIDDYLLYYKERLEYSDADLRVMADVYESRCLQLENDFFRTDPEKSAVLDTVLRQVIHNPEDYGKLPYRLSRIRNVQHRLTKVIHPNP